ncbi:MAG: hypothetical protein ACQERE_07040 [Pseudomonadota bacterium]
MTQTALCALCLLPLTGCIGGDDGGGGDGLDTGTLMHVGIENVHYETRSQSGTTNEDGEFRYNPGETLTFRVGDLVLAEDVPAAPFLTPIDFTADARQKLQKGGVGNDELQTHRRIEEQLAANDRQAVNITRLLMVLSDDNTDDPNETLTITQRTLDQINSYLAKEDTPEIDFDVPVQEFASPSIEGEDSRNDDGDLKPAISSPANLMLDSICFAPEGDDVCDTPPKRSSINAISDEEEREDLQQERDSILESRRTLQDLSANATTAFLEEDTLIFKGDLESPFYLAPETLTISASDSSIQEVTIKRTGSSDVTLKDLEAKVEGNDWIFDSADWQSGTVRFYHDGPSTESGTVVVNFKVDYPDFNNYRWFQKTLRVHVN